MDPYCQFYSPNLKKSFKLPFKKNAGKNPVWDESLEIRVENDDCIMVEVTDWNEYNDHQLIGEGAFSILNASCKKSKEVSLPIFYKGKNAGTLNFNLSLK